MNRGRTAKEPRTMKFKSPILSEASGSVAGLTASHNRYGMYFRQRVIPVNPATGLQVSIRGIFGNLSTAWQDSLTQTQRDAWELYASNVTLTDSLGNQVNVTGANMFIRCNTPRLQVGLPQVDDGPTEFSLGAFTQVGGVLSGSGDSYTVVFDNTDDWANEDGGGLLFYFGRPQAPTINFFKGPYRYGGIVLGDAVTAPTSPAALTPLPWTYTSDQAGFIRCVASRADGRLSPTQRIRTIVT